MTLNHSKTWPVTTLAVVQLRVDPQGRTYSALTGQFPDCPTGNFIGAEESEGQYGQLHPACGNSDAPFPEDTSKGHTPEDEGENGILYPLSKKHLELFTKMSGPTMRTTIRSDTVSTILEQDTEFDFEQEHGKPKDDVEKFHVLALTRIEETVNEHDIAHPVGRRPSIKVDNWDFIYTEAKPSRCPVHCCLNEPNGAPPKDTNDLPLDARKTTTLRRHYYPEGGWGWVVVVCSVLVHVLNHGVQLSCSQLVLPGTQKFKVEAVHFAGVCLLNFVGVSMLVVEKMYDPNYSNLHLFIYSYFIGQAFVAAAITLFTFANRIDFFLKAFESLHKVDQRLLKLGLHFSYKYIQAFQIFVCSLFVIIPAIFAIFDVIDNRDSYQTSANNLSFGLEFATTTFALFYWTCVMVTLSSRLTIINNYLGTLHIAMGRNRIRQRMVYISEFHQEIHKITDMITYSVSPNILMFFIICAFCITLFTLSCFFKAWNNFKHDLILWAIIYTAIIVNISVCAENLSRQGAGSITTLIMFMLQLEQYYEGVELAEIKH